MNNTCVNCDIEFESIRKSKFCSSKCRQKYNYDIRKENGINPYELQRNRGELKKIQAVISKGGKCAICDYDKNLAALEFHHTDPEIKEFQLDLRVFSNLSWEVLNNELTKCTLLCSNCHRELHNQNKNNWKK